MTHSTPGPGNLTDNTTLQKIFYRYSTPAPGNLMDNTKLQKIFYRYSTPVPGNFMDNTTLRTPQFTITLHLQLATWWTPQHFTVTVRLFLATWLIKDNIYRYSMHASGNSTDNTTLQTQYFTVTLRLCLATWWTTLHYKHNILPLHYGCTWQLDGQHYITNTSVYCYSMPAPGKLTDNTTLQTQYFAVTLCLRLATWWTTLHYKHNILSLLYVCAWQLLGQNYITTQLLPLLHAWAWQLDRQYYITDNCNNYNCMIALWHISTNGYVAP